jgi:hypothetical protein
MLRVAVAGLLAASFAIATAHAQDRSASLGDKWRELRADLRDPSDGQFDVSAILERAHGFLPIPSS